MVCLWFAWLRCGHINKLAATGSEYIGTLGVVIIDRGILRSVRERGREVRSRVSFLTLPRKGHPGLGESDPVEFTADKWAARGRLRVIFSLFSLADSGRTS